MSHTSLSQKKVTFISLISTILLIIIDQITKHFAFIKLRGQTPFQLIDGVFELRYLENRGAAFGILQGKKIFFVIITLVFLVILVWIFSKIPMNKKFKWIRLIIVLFFAGAVGNFIDRVINNYVIDFFYFKLIDFPIFNVADIYVTIAAFLFIFLFLFHYKEEDLKEIFPEKTKDTNVEKEK